MDPGWRNADPQSDILKKKEAPSDLNTIDSGPEITTWRRTVPELLINMIDSGRIALH